MQYRLLDALIQNIFIYILVSLFLIRLVETKDPIWLFALCLPLLMLNIFKPDPE